MKLFLIVINTICLIVGVILLFDNKEVLPWFIFSCFWVYVMLYSIKERPKTCRVTFLREIQHHDSHGNVVHLGLYEDGSGGLFAVDSSYLSDTDEPTYNPFTGELINPSDL